MRNDIILLRTILYYCNEIEYAIEKTGNDMEDFLDSKMCQHACSFCIEQIGKNVKDLSNELTNKHHEIPWNNIAGMRDIIAHKYHRVDLNKIWLTITEEIPLLKDACEKILREIETR